DGTPRPRPRAPRTRSRGPASTGPRFLLRTVENVPHHQDVVPGVVVRFDATRELEQLPRVETHELVLQVLTKLVLLGTLRYVHRSSFHRQIGRASCRERA